MRLKSIEVGVDKGQNFPVACYNENSVQLYREGVCVCVCVCLCMCVCACVHVCVCVCVCVCVTVHVLLPILCECVLFHCPLEVTQHMKIVSNESFISTNCHAVQRYKIAP